jgi:transposase-like protein
MQPILVCRIKRKLLQTGRVHIVMMAERGFEVDHSSVHRWVIKLVPLFEKAFRRHNRPVGKSWRMDETYVKVARPVEVLVSRSGQGR